MSVPAPSDRLARPLRDLRLSVTDRCNFRCPYCMPAELFGDRYRFLPRPELLTFEEIERLARIFAGLGARKVRITGGEPLVRAELPKLVAKLAAIEGVDDLALTTNGFLLSDHAPALAHAGLRRVTVSLDAHDEPTFQSMNGGRPGRERVLEGIEAARRVGMTPVKINCVVRKGVNDHAIEALAREFRGTGHVLRFIEYMDVGTLNGWNLGEVTTAREIVERLDRAFGVDPVERSYPGEVASRYRYRDGAGEVGVISSVTQPFCSACTRARLSAAGQLVTCLFASGGTDLKTPLRAGESDSALRDRIAGIWRARDDRYSEERSAETGVPGGAERSRIEMYELGG